MFNFEIHPDYALVLKICQQLRLSGFQTYLAGGCVRDALLGIQPKDFDLATTAHPEDVERVFSKTVPVGKSFGVIVVIENGKSFEVASFRSDGQYSDGRKPDAIVFSSAQEDAKRRDFTMNALFFDPLEGKLIDYVGGQADIHAQMIRAVGDPVKRFQEDHLRILRAVRFACQLGFDIESETWSAAQENAHLIAKVSHERQRDELGKLLAGRFFSLKLDLVLASGVLKVLFPQLQLDAKKWIQYFQMPAGEKKWLQFWLWCYHCNSHLSKSQWEAELDRLRFSRAEKSFILDALSWFLIPGKLESQSIGQSVHDIFQPGFEAGFLALRHHLSLAQEIKWNNIYSRKLQLGENLPIAHVQAADLPQLQGKELGTALNRIFYAQLEGIVTSKTSGLDYWQKERK